MATVIRLKRGGRTHAPYYRIVVTDSRNKTTGRVIEEIGVYQPCARPEPRVEIDAPKALEWLQHGARPSDTARNLFKKHGIMAALAEGKKPEELAPVAEGGGDTEAQTPQPAAATVGSGEES